MYKTKEMRWFFREENHHLETWFASHGIKFDGRDETTDIYLNAEQDNIGIKLRDGNIETKRLRSVPRGRKSFNGNSGYIEEWVKWSFAVEEPDDEYIGIVERKEKNWIEVIKNRLAVHIADTKGKLSVRPVSAGLDFGCQVEYTKVRIGDSMWYTFALEWSGNRFLELPEPFMKEILGSSKLTLKRSKGYAAFLKENF